MDLANISYYDLYFYSAMALDALSGREAVVDAMMRGRFGPDWAQELATQVQAYRHSVDKIIRQKSETAQARVDMSHLLEGLSTWREGMVSATRLVAADKQKLMMQAAGWGAGSPRTVKDAKDLLLTIKSRLSTLYDDFIQLGVAPAMLEYPGTTLLKLEAASTALSKEKAEDAVVQSKLHSLRAIVQDMLNALYHASKAALSQALVLEQDSQPAQNLLEVLEQSMKQTRVQSRKKAQKVQVPTMLTSGDKAEESPDLQNDGDHDGDTADSGGENSDDTIHDNTGDGEEPVTS